MSGESDDSYHSSNDSDSEYLENDKNSRGNTSVNVTKVLGPFVDKQLLEDPSKQLEYRKQIYSQCVAMFDSLFPNWKFKKEAIKPHNSSKNPNCIGNLTLEQSEYLRRCVKRNGQSQEGWRTIRDEIEATFGIKTNNLKSEFNMSTNKEALSEDDTKVYQLLYIHNEGFSIIARVLDRNDHFIKNHEKPYKKYYPDITGYRTKEKSRKPKRAPYTRNSSPSSRLKSAESFDDTDSQTQSTQGNTMSKSKVRSNSQSDSSYLPVPQYTETPITLPPMPNTQDPSKPTVYITSSSIPIYQNPQTYITQPSTLTTRIPAGTQKQGVIPPPPFYGQYAYYTNKPIYQERPVTTQDPVRKENQEYIKGTNKHILNDNTASTSATIQSNIPSNTPITTQGTNLDSNGTSTYIYAYNYVPNNTSISTTTMNYLPPPAFNNQPTQLSPQGGSFRLPVTYPNSLSSSSSNTNNSSNNLLSNSTKEIYTKEENRNKEETIQTREQIQSSSSYDAINPLLSSQHNNIISNQIDDKRKNKPYTRNRDSRGDRDNDRIEPYKPVEDVSITNAVNNYIQNSIFVYDTHNTLNSNDTNNTYIPKMTTINNNIIPMPTSFNSRDMLLLYPETSIIPITPSTSMDLSLYPSFSERYIDESNSIFINPQLLLDSNSDIPILHQNNEDIQRTRLLYGSAKDVMLSEEEKAKRIPIIIENPEYLKKDKHEDNTIRPLKENDTVNMVKQYYETPLTEFGETKQMSNPSISMIQSQNKIINKDPNMDVDMKLKSSSSSSLLSSSSIHDITSNNDNSSINNNDNSTIHNNDNSTINSNDNSKFINSYTQQYINNHQQTPSYYSINESRSPDSCHESLSIEESNAKGINVPTTINNNITNKTIQPSIIPPIYIDNNNINSNNKTNNIDNTNNNRIIPSTMSLPTLPYVSSTLPIINNMNIDHPKTSIHVNIQDKDYMYKEFFQPKELPTSNPSTPLAKDNHVNINNLSDNTYISNKKQSSMVSNSTLSQVMHNISDPLSSNPSSSSSPSSSLSPTFQPSKPILNTNSNIHLSSSSSSTTTTTTTTATTNNNNTGIQNPLSSNSSLKYVLTASTQSDASFYKSFDHNTLYSSYDNQENRIHNDFQEV
ncbi:hypothetical protein WA158_002712 [Blastocystis sp. Blastoise]